MSMPRGAKYRVNWGDIPADTVDADMMVDDDDYVFGTVTADEFTGDLVGDVTGNADTATVAAGVDTDSGTDILIATLTAKFGDPATLDDGTMFVFKETTSDPDKMYLVVVMAGAFYLEELTAAAAE